MSGGNGTPEIPPKPDEIGIVGGPVDIKANIAAEKAKAAAEAERRKQEDKQAAEQIRANNEAANRAIEALRAGEPLQDEGI